MLTEKQRAHARRNALQDAPAYAKGRTVTPEKITQYTEYQASLIAPKREPARTQWKEQYRDSFTAYMINSGHMEREEEPAEDERGLTIQEAARRVQAREAARMVREADAYQEETRQLRKEALARRRALAHGDEPEPPVITPLPAVNHREEAAKYKALADNVSYHYRAKAREAYEREIAAAEAQEQAAAPPAPKVQVTKDGPAYLLPGIEPVGKQKGDTEQLAMF